MTESKADPHRSTIIRACATLARASYCEGVSDEQADAWRALAGDARSAADALAQGRAAGEEEGYARGHDDGQRLIADIRLRSMEGAGRMARAMVAALYWRAGEAEARAHRYRTHEAAWDYYNSEAMFLRSAAQAMGLHL